ncbi:MAG TPA: lysylphosphatidylglycerol synthase domain-containing protein [Bacteroidota bacterium]|nr:lysylphosphatidylglycerol synthase domain-containing protein [Bacteroidota bacterium]
MMWKKILKSASRWVLRPALVAVLLVLLWRNFSGLQIALVADRIGAMGLAALLVPLPYALVFWADTMAWRCTIRSRPAPEVGGVFRVRVATDAILNSIPGGVAVAEPLRPVLLRRECGVDLTEGIGSCIITKITIAIAQSAFILVGCVLLLRTTPGVAAALGLAGGTRGVAMLAAATILVVALLLVPFSGPRIEQSRRLLARIPLPPLRSLLERAGPAVARLDSHVGGFARDHGGRLAFSIGYAFIGWLAVGGETLLVLNLLGAHPTFIQAVALESTASVLRVVFFFLPGGLGASEVGFVTLLVAFGFPDPITLSAAYIAVKRLKEALWIAAGYLLLWTTGVHPFTSSK